MVETPEEAFSWTRSTDDAPDEAQILEIEFAKKILDKIIDLQISQEPSIA